MKVPDGSQCLTQKNNFIMRNKPSCQNFTWKNTRITGEKNKIFYIQTTKYFTLKYSPPGIVLDPSAPALLMVRSCECRSTRRWWRIVERRWDSCGVRTQRTPVLITLATVQSCLLDPSSQTPDTTSASVLLFLTDLQVSRPQSVAIFIFMIFFFIFRILSHTTQHLRRFITAAPSQRHVWRQRCSWREQRLRVTNLWCGNSFLNNICNNCVYYVNWGCRIFSSLKASTS